MAYDSKTYGQSPFGAPKSTDGVKASSADKSQRSGAVSNTTISSDGLADDGLDRGPTDGPNLADRFPTIPAIKPPAKGPAAPAPKSGKDSAAKADSAVRKSDRKSRAKSAAKSAAKSSAKSGSKRKSSRQAKAEAQAEAEAAELAIAQRFQEEDRRVYLSLLYKTGISGLVWAVLRLLRHELSERAISVINTLIDPIMVATVALIGILGLTFWARRLLNDLAQHTQQLQTDAEADDDKSYRPTVEIIGDALEYNPKLRKHLAQLFNASTVLLCSLVSYLVTFALFPTSS